MKQIKFFSLTLAVLAIFSCSKGTINSAENDNPGEKAKLTINVVGQETSNPSKVGGGTTSSDKRVNDYIAFVFRAGGVLDCPAKGLTGDGTLSFDAATTAAAKVYVIANTGALANGIFASVTTEADLKNVVGDLMSSANVSSQTSTNVWMSGVGDVVFPAETPTVGTAVVTISFVASKIELFVKDSRTNNDPAVNTAAGSVSIKDDEVVLLFAGKNGKFFETAIGDRATQTSFYTGDNSYTDPFNRNVTLSSVFSDNISASPFDKNALKVVNHFYTFANNGATQATILAIKSTRTEVGVGTSTIYYPIHFVAADAKHTIVPGTHYKVNIVLKGDVNKGGGGGTIDPETPWTSAEIEVTIQPADWLTETIDKEFN